MAQHIAAMQLRFGPAAWRVVEQAGCLHRLSSWRSFASEGAATTKPAADDDASTSSSSEVARRLASPAAAGAAPWPFIDPSLPTDLPHFLPPRPRREELPLMTILQKIKEFDTTYYKRYRRSLVMALRLAVDPRRADHMLRGTVVLPHGLTKRATLCVFASGADAEIARSQGADVIGDEALVERIAAEGASAVTFDRVLCTPDMMKHVTKAGRVLGPMGLMPNPKQGTLVKDVAAAIAEVRRGRLEFRVDKNSVMLLPLGPVSKSAEELAENVGALGSKLLEIRPKSLPGTGLPNYVASVKLTCNGLRESHAMVVSSWLPAIEAYRAKYGGGSAGEGGQ